MDNLLFIPQTLGAGLGGSLHVRRVCYETVSVPIRARGVGNPEYYKNLRNSRLKTIICFHSLEAAWRAHNRIIIPSCDLL